MSRAVTTQVLELENYVNGAWRRATASEFADVTNPASAELLARTPLSSPADVEGVDEMQIRQPLGVVAAITPFNFPAMVPYWFLPYAIACGNTFILKPSERVPLSMRRAFELLEKTGLPKGVVNLVNGGRDAVHAL